MSKRYSASDPTANAIPKDHALTLAAQAKARGDEAGFDRFMAAARWEGVA